jgi:HEAT repeat protein
MVSNDSTKQNTNPPDRIRLKVLGPIGLLLVLIIVGIILTRAHSPTPPTARSVEGSTNTIASNTSQPSLHAVALAKNRSSPPETEPETARLISVMSDPSAAQPLRRQAARALAKIGTDEALAALKAALSGDAPPYVKAAIAEGLGESPNPDARELLKQLANSQDETIARAAARGLAARGDSEAVDTLAGLLFNNDTPLSVRTEAALALGDVNLPSAQDQLTKALSQIQDEDVVESILDGMGRRPFSDTEEFFRNYLNSPEVSADSKVLAIEAITDSEGGDVSTFLSGYVNDPNPALRDAAKHALDFLDPNPPPPPGSHP